MQSNGMKIQSDHATVDQPRISRADDSIIETNIPARLDRLPWGSFHTILVVALGITWILDGLEVTLAGILSGAIRLTLQLTNSEVQLTNTLYLGGAIVGALFFGRLTDRYGRKALFFITLAVYLIATAATAASWNLWSLAACRLVTGAGIGGEYAAINSAIQEFVPKRFRGQADLLINGSFWLGAAAGAGSSIVLLNPSIFDPNFGWRLGFFLGALLALLIFFMRMWIPESPRWLMTHHRVEEALAVVKSLEDKVTDKSKWSANPRRVSLRGRRRTSLREVGLTLLYVYPRRTIVCLILMAAQAFCYNAIFFNYESVLVNFFNVAREQVGFYFLAFALGNLIGPIALGRAFDTLGRKPMITFTYAMSGLLLAVSAYFFLVGKITAWEQTVAWMAVFFFASAAASSAYLTVGETFPLEIRALAIAIFFAIGTGVGGLFSPWLFGALIDTGSRASLFAGYLLASAMMLIAAIVEWRWGIAAERKPLEKVARPLTFTD